MIYSDRLLTLIALGFAGAIVGVLAERWIRPATEGGSLLVIGVTIGAFFALAGVGKAVRDFRHRTHAPAATEAPRRRSHPDAERGRSRATGTAHAREEAPRQHDGAGVHRRGVGATRDTRDPPSATAAPGTGTDAADRDRSGDGADSAADDGPPKRSPK